MENTLYLETIINRTPCPRHGVPKGSPCFHLDTMNGHGNNAICNKRARSAGFVGLTHPIRQRNPR